MKYPIVVLEGDDVKMFEAPRELYYLEAIDVRAGEYEALDSEGCPVDLDVDLLGRVIAVDRVDGIPEPERLADILRRDLAFLAAHPRGTFPAEPPDSASLAELIDAALPYAVEPPRPTPSRPSWLKRRRSAAWPRISYRDFYDRPRAFLVEWGAATYFFDSPFSEVSDEYSPTYSITRLIGVSEPDLRRSWRELAQRGERVGHVAVQSIEFDPTFRSRINPEVFDRIEAP